MTGNHFSKRFGAIETPFLCVPVESFPNMGRDTCGKPFILVLTGLETTTAHMFVCTGDRH